MSKGNIPERDYSHAILESEKMRATTVIAAVVTLISDSISASELYYILYSSASLRSFISTSASNMVPFSAYSSENTLPSARILFMKEVLS